MWDTVRIARESSQRGPHLPAEALQEAAVDGGLHLVELGQERVLDDVDQDLAHHDHQRVLWGKERKYRSEENFQSSKCQRGSFASYCV